MAKILLEDVCGKFRVDRSTGDKGVLAEKLESGTPGVIYKIPGSFSLSETVNGNGRSYPRRVWELNLTENSHLQGLISRNESFGLLEHPSDGVVNLNSPISHLVTKAYMTESGEVRGEITLLDTYEGRKMKTLIQAGYDPYVSSRGYGSVVEEGGVNIVQEDFICEGWDLVHTPSFATAQLTPQREGRVKESVATDVPANSAPAPEESAVLQESDEKPAQTSGAQKQAVNESSTIMDPNTIRNQLSALTMSINESLTPKKAASAVSRLEDLHNEVDVWESAEAARGHKARKLHEEIDEAIQAINDIQSKPAADLVRMTESRDKTLRFSKLVVEQATAYKKGLSKQLNENQKVTKLYESTLKKGREILERGKRWREKYLKLESASKTLNENLDVVSTALDTTFAAKKQLESQLAEAQSDVIKLSKELIKFKFAESITDEEKKSVREAKTEDELSTIVEAIKERSKPGEKQITEGKKAGAKPAAKPEGEQVTEATTKKVVINSGENQFEGQINLSGAPDTLTEGVAIAKRLSAASQQAVQG